MSLTIFWQNTDFSINNNYNKKNDNTYNESDNPRISDGEITIITPENKTYTSPMSGYYPGTDSFDDTEDGNVPKGWVDLSTMGGSISVIDELGGHKKVLNLHASPTDHFGAKTYIEFEPQTSGSIEWWMRSTEIYGDYLQVQFYDSADTFVSRVMIRRHWGYGTNDIDGYNSGTNVPIKQGISTNIWYHVRWDFDINAGTWEAWVDGVDYATSFLDGGNNISKIVFQTYEEGFDGYIDGVGITGISDGYQVGESSEEGLLLSFENSTTLDWMGYSLNGQANRTILGNTSISMPSGGSHNIQLFGNSTSGIMYESAIRYFTVGSGDGPTPPPNGDDDEDGGDGGDGGGDDDDDEGDKPSPTDYSLILITSVVIGIVGVGGGLIYYGVKRRSKISEKKSRIKTPKKPKKAKKVKKAKKPKIKKLSKEIVSDLINCPFCHNKITGDQDFCTYCGSSLKEVKKDE